MSYKPGAIVYCQGRWKCRVVSQDGDRLHYIALEGYGPRGRGASLTADVTLFTKKKQRPVTTTKQAPSRGATPTDTKCALCGLIYPQAHPKPCPYIKGPEGIPVEGRAYLRCTFQPKVARP